MREPILQDKRQEHVKFQKHGLELLEQVSGRIKSNVNEFEVSLAKIHKADVVINHFLDKSQFWKREWNWHCCFYFRWLRRGSNSTKNSCCSWCINIFLARIWSNRLLFSWKRQVYHRCRSRKPAPISHLIERPTVLHRLSGALLVLPLWLPLLLAPRRLH